MKNTTLLVQGFPVEQALSDKLLQKTKFVHVAGDPTSIESLREANIGNAQASTSLALVFACLLDGSWQAAVQ